MASFGLCRSAVGAASADAVPAASEPALTEADRREWQIFKRRFISPDGRVIDTGNDCVSHTEGQGWGMLSAVAFDDMEAFERIHGWTRRVLRRSSDALHCWRYDPAAADPVADPNNATDGDIFIAWALWRAACRWQRPADAAAARAIAADILTLLVREAGERTVLLPAAAGFESAVTVDVNPSYYCFQALAELSHAVPSPLWDKLQADGLALIAAGRFGQWQLPPDWLSVSRDGARLTPAAGWPARFSYDAIRVPLYLAWARRSLPDVHRAFADYWSQTDPRTPAWVDLHTGATASYPAPPGMVAVAKVATAAAKTSLPPGFPSIHTSPDYYSSALILLARLAWHESRGA
ncbi:MAG: glycosyl hydrolase family 5 [Acidisphaera sp.]|nr:glycosyl hydrolase family 5 [Acidisphaera sp.]